MDAHHRKIDLQSPSDLTYLFHNIKSAARQKMDLAIPPSAAPEGEDAYRSKVEELVQEVVLSSAFLSAPQTWPVHARLIAYVFVVYSADAHPRPSIADSQRS